MNAPPVKRIVSQRVPGVDDYIDWLQRTGHPILRDTEDLANKLSQNGIETFTADGGISPDTDVAKVDASAGSILVVLPEAAVWEKRIIVVKTDATANTVTVVGSVSSVVIGTQYGSAEFVCDGSNYYPVGSAGLLGGDVTGPIGANTVVRLQNRALASTAPTKYELIGSQDGATWQPRKEGMPSFPDATTTFSLTAGSVDTVAVTIPASPTGSGRFVLMRAYLRLSTALGVADAGTVAVRIGTTVGGQEIATDQTVNNATALGTIFSGLSRASRGASLLVANNYEASLAAGASINVRATTTGTITSGACTLYVYGGWLP